MCEWLSHGEWCDAYLLCGGGVFRAHRAVLASVSSFLRHVFLSCPMDDSPTFIALPEFDFDAMSLVLYYIYNGEVVIQEGQLTKFLDIMGTMQIFVDSQCLSKVNEDITKRNYNMDIHSRNVERDDQFLVCTVNGNKQYVHVKRCTKQCDSRNIEINRDRYIYHSVSGSSDNGAGYLKSQWKGRQRQQFPRDLFIETDKVNRSSNGAARGVQEITNESYREPTSVLLRNANVENLKANVTKQEKSVDRIDKNAHNPLEHEQQYVKKCNEVSCIPNHSDRTCQIEINLLCSTNVSNDFIPEKYLGSSKTSETTDIQTKWQLTPVCLNRLKCDVGGIHMSKNTKNDNITRVAIMNKVLQNPWTSLSPYDYIPFHRKRCLSTIKQKTLKTVIVDNNSLDDHNHQHSSSKYTCQECQKTFSQLRNYKYHISVHRGTKEFATTCPVCGKLFNDKGYLSSHMKIHRNRKEYKCSVCPKSFNQRVAYTMHIRIHTGIKPHVCDECGKGFSRRMLLKQHQRTHSGERPYACSHCDKRFADRSNMTLHLRLHTGEKPFNCTLCPKSFTKKHHLKSHLNFHTGVKPYSCPMCSLGFTQSSNMRTHLKKCQAL